MEVERAVVSNVDSAPYCKYCQELEMKKLIFNICQVDCLDAICHCIYILNRLSYPPRMNARILL